MGSSHGGGYILYFEPLCTGFKPFPVYFQFSQKKIDTGHVRIGP
jgi:hypothetical protein